MTKKKPTRKSVKKVVKKPHSAATSPFKIPITSEGSGNGRSGQPMNLMGSEKALDTIFDKSVKQTSEEKWHWLEFIYGIVIGAVGMVSMLAAVDKL